LVPPLSYLFTPPPVFRFLVPFFCHLFAFPRTSSCRIVETLSFPFPQRPPLLTAPVFFLFSLFLWPEHALPPCHCFPPAAPAITSSPCPPRPFNFLSPSKLFQTWIPLQFFFSPPLLLLHGRLGTVLPPPLGVLSFFFGMFDFPSFFFGGYPETTPVSRTSLQTPFPNFTFPFFTLLFL